MRLIMSAITLFVMSISCSNNSSSTSTALIFKAHMIGELPSIVLNEKNRGVAGAFSGIVHNKLIIAGGTYFPDEKPWEGGIKKYEDKIYALELGEETAKTMLLSLKLPAPVAYGASITLPGGILCIGGNDPDKCLSKVFLIKWNETNGNPEIEQFPELPVPLSYTSAVLSDHIVYVVGGSTTPDGKETKNYFFKLDLKESNSNTFKWEKLPAHPGMGRILSVMVVQSNGIRKCLYLFSGRNVSNTEKPVVMNDGLVYDPVLQIWEQVRVDSPYKFQVMAGSAFPYGSDNIVFVGGAPDSTFLKEQSLKTELSKSLTNQNIANSNRIKTELLQYYVGHPGFSPQILVYNTVKNSISNAGTFDAFCPVTTNAIPFRDGALIACGEIKPGIRTPLIYKIQLNK